MKVQNDVIKSFERLSKVMRLELFDNAPLFTFQLRTFLDGVMHNQSKLLHNNHQLCFLDL